MLLKLEVDGASNQVVASHHFLESKAYKAWRSGRMRWREFGTPIPHASLWSKLAEAADMAAGSLGLTQGMTDNASVSVVPQPGGKVVALSETVAATYPVDVATLATLGQVQYQDDVSADKTTAHPSRLPNGDLIQMFNKIGGGFTITRQTPDNFQQRQTLAQIPSRRRFAPAWVHDFPSSVNYTGKWGYHGCAVLPEVPLYLSPISFLTGKPTDHQVFKWVPEEATLLHVVSHQTGQASSSLAVVAFYDDASQLNRLTLDFLRKGRATGQEVADAHYRRLTIDLQAPPGTQLAGWQPLIDDESSYGHHFEFPSSSPSNSCRPYRYAYGVCAVRPTNTDNAYVKMDNQERTCKVFPLPGGIGGEPRFVPAPNPASEDDGILLGTVVQPDGNAAMVFLDGRSMEEVARAVLRYGLPFGFHGTFIPS
ncbi:hypothetical protein N2152v2_011004 [Parachlorella kessleri]